MLLNWSCIVLLFVFGKKLRLKGDTDDEFVLLLVFPWRSGSCKRPWWRWSCLFENGEERSCWKVWFGSLMKKGEEDIDCCCGDCCCCCWTNDDDDGCKGEIKWCSYFGVQGIFPRVKMLFVDVCWFWFRAKPMWFVENRCVAKGFMLEGCLAFSCASASQNALWVMKLSRLKKEKKTLSIPISLLWISFYPYIPLITNKSKFIKREKSFKKTMKSINSALEQQKSAKQILEKE